MARQKRCMAVNMMGSLARPLCKEFDLEAVEIAPSLFANEESRLLEQGLTPPYHNFIDIYLERMRGYGENALVPRPGEWKHAMGSAYQP